MTDFADVKFLLEPQSTKLELDANERVVVGPAIFLEVTQALINDGLDSWAGADLHNIVLSALNGPSPMPAGDVFDTAVIQESHYGSIGLRTASSALGLTAGSLITILFSDIMTSEPYSNVADIPLESSTPYFRLLRPNQVYTRQSDGSLVGETTVALSDTVLRDDTTQVGTFGGSEWTWLTPGLASSFMDQRLLIIPTSTGAIADDETAIAFGENQGLGDPNTGGSIYTRPLVVGAWYVRADGMPRVWNGSVWSNVLKFNLLEGTVPGVAALIGESDTIVGFVKDGEIHLGVKNQAVDAGWLEGKTLAEIEQSFNLRIDAKIEAGRLRRTHRGTVFGKHNFADGTPTDNRYVSESNVYTGSPSVRIKADLVYLFDSNSQLLMAYTENDPIIRDGYNTWDPLSSPLPAPVPSGRVVALNNADLATSIEVSHDMVISFTDGLVTELRWASDPLELDGLATWDATSGMPADGVYKVNTDAAGDTVAVVQSSQTLQYKKDFIYLVEGGEITEDPAGLEPADRLIIIGGENDEDFPVIYGITTNEQADYGNVGEYNWNPAREQFSSQEHLYVAELTGSGGLIAYVTNAISDFLTTQEIQGRIDAATATFVSSDEIQNRINTAVQDFVTSTAIDERVANTVKDAFDARFVYGTFNPREIRTGVGLDANVGQPYATTSSPTHFYYSVPNTDVTLQFLSHDNGLTWRDVR